MDQLAQRAVQAALKGEWEEAKKLNESILQLTEDDRDALNRLARAYFELGNNSKSLQLYKKVLSRDPYNSIAQKAVERLEKLKGKKPNGNGNHTNGTLVATTFLEEPGKTKAANLIHLGSPELISGLNVGDKIKLTPHAHRVSAETLDGDFIGRLPDDLSSRIIKFCKAGNEYDAYVKSATPSTVKVFIRETKRGESVLDIPSFPITDKANYVAFTPPDLIHEEKPEVETLEQELQED